MFIKNNKIKKFVNLLIIALITVNILLITTFIYKDISNRTRNATTGTVFIVKKIKDNPLKIVVREKIHSTKEDNEFSILVNNENVWNLIDEEQTYFIVYSQGSGNKLYLDQIEKNDDHK
jgi:hypothetical protein